MDTPDLPDTDFHPSPLHGDADARLPAAAFLRYQARADGWSAGRQAAFLAHLADHGLVGEAARSVGMSVAGGYALRRQARGYAFGLGWEAALLVARRIVQDNLMTAAIRGEESRWVREDGVTTYTRQNTRLSLALLDRVNPVTSLPEVLAVVTRFDWYLDLVDQGASAEDLWEYFFDAVLPKSEIEARHRVRVSLQLCEESADFDEDEAEEEEEKRAPLEYKSMDAVGLLPYAKAQRREGKMSEATLCGFVASCERPFLPTREPCAAGRKTSHKATKPRREKAVFRRFGARLNPPPSVRPEHRRERIPSESEGLAALDRVPRLRSGRTGFSVGGCLTPWGT